MNRNLDGIFFRIERGGKFDNVCFSDLTEEEMDFVLRSKNDEWLKSLCKALGKTIHHIGDELELMFE